MVHDGVHDGGDLRGFGDLEAVIMHRVWEHAEPVTVRELHVELSAERVIAYTTGMPGGTRTGGGQVVAPPPATGTVPARIVQLAR